MWYTIQTSDHPGASARVPTTEAAASWQTQHDGLISTPEKARALVEQYARCYRNARAFRGKNLGRLWYAVLRYGG